MLNDLVRGAGPSSSEATESAGLSGLVAGAAVPRMTLVGALNAMKRGQIEQPLDGAIGELIAPDMPPQPAPSPQPLSYQAELDEARIDARVDRDEMRDRIRRKRDQLQATVSYSNDVRANQQEARRRHEITARLDAAERELTEMGNG